MFKKILVYILENPKIVIIGILLLLVFILYKCSSNKEHEVDILSNNIKALQDSVSVIKIKNGQIESEKNILFSDIKKLKDLNIGLSEELEKEKGNVKIIEKVVVVYEKDTIYIDNTDVTQLNDTTYRLSWVYEHKDASIERTIIGENTFNIDSTRILYNARTIIKKDKILLNLVTGIREEDGLYKIFIRLKEKDSENFVTFKDIEGAILDEYILGIKKKKRWSVGPYVGIGLNSILPDVKISPSIGISVQYIIFSF